MIDIETRLKDSEDPHREQVDHIMLDVDYSFGPVAPQFSVERALCARVRFPCASM